MHKKYIFSNIIGTFIFNEHFKLLNKKLFTNIEQYNNKNTTEKEFLKKYSNLNKPEYPTKNPFNVKSNSVRWTYFDPENFSTSSLELDIKQGCIALLERNNTSLLKIIICPKFKSS